MDLSNEFSHFLETASNEDMADFFVERICLDDEDKGAMERSDYDRIKELENKLTIEYGLKGNLNQATVEAVSRQLKEQRGARLLSTRLKIVSGGQTGADQGALAAADWLCLDYGGWAPHGWRTESGTVPVCFRADMRERPEKTSLARSYRDRMKANVRDSDATLIVADRLPLEGGSARTCEYAANIGKPHLAVALSAPDAIAVSQAWSQPFAGGRFVLNVAGPRESKAPGIQQKVKSFLRELYDRLAADAGFLSTDPCKASESPGGGI